MARADGFSRVRLARMSEVMRGYVERGEVAGVLTLLCRHEEIHVDAIGARDRDSGAPIARDTIFRLASMTKPITAAAAMILVEETKLRLDEPVDRWLPELADREVLRNIEGPLTDTVPADRPLTLRDLVTFRLGIGMVMTPGQFPIQRAMAERDLGPGPTPSPFAPEAWIARFAELPLMYQPGTRWLYHTGFDVLSALIARAAGMPFEDFLTERIFEPLGMRDTTFNVPEAKLDRLSACYRLDARTKSLICYADDRGGRSTRHAVAPAGSTGLASTIDDYLAFGRMMLNGGRHGAERILSRPTVEVMTTDQLTPEQKATSPFFPGFWENHGWGFGVSMITRRDAIAAVPGRFGWNGGFGTSWCSDPREDLVGILMVQRLHDPVVTTLHEDFWTLAYQAID